MKFIRFDILCILALLIAGLSFFWQMGLGKLPVPTDTLVGLYHPWRDRLAQNYPRGYPFKNFLITDPVRQQIPWRREVIQAFQSKTFPAWDPTSFSGTTLLGNVQSGALYPLNILFFFLPFDIAWSVLVVLGPLIACAAMYAYLRNRSLSIIPSAYGGLLYGFCGFFISWLCWGTMTHVAAWFPFSLLALDVLFASHRWKQKCIYSIVLCLTLVFQITAGHIQIALYCFTLLFFYTGYRLWREMKATHKTPRKLFWIIGAAAGAVVLTLPVWVPFLQFIAQTPRGMEGAVWQKEGFFLPWQHLVQFIAPDFFGNPATLNYFGIWNYGEFIGYIGVVGLMFAFVGMLTRHLKIGLWLLFICFLFMLPTPLSKLPYQFQIPFLSSLQPTRLLVVVEFLLSAFAAYGLSEWINGKNKKAILQATAVVVFFIVVAWTAIVLIHPGFTTNQLSVARRNILFPTALVGLGLMLLLSRLWIGRKTKLIAVGIVLIFGVTVFDLFRFGWKYTPFTPRSLFFPTTETILFLQKQPKPFRIMSLDDRLFPPDTFSYYGLEFISGYDPLYSKRYEEFMAVSERGKADLTRPFGFDRIIQPKNISSPLLPLLNVTYVVSLADENQPFLRKAFQEGETRVYEYTKALPRAYFASDIVVETKDTEILGKLLAVVSADPFIAVVEKPIDVLSVPLSELESVVIDSVLPNSLTLRTKGANSRYLVFSVPYDGKWHVRIDNKTAILYRTNFIFMGCIIPAGSHTVELVHSIL